MSGADPLFRSDHGTCALDEAKDSSMETLLMKYIPQQKKCHLSGKSEVCVIVGHVDRIVELELRIVETEFISPTTFEKVHSMMSLFYSFIKTHCLFAIVHKKRTIK
jgi:hypothetical protein